MNSGRLVNLWDIEGNKWAFEGRNQVLEREFYSYEVFKRYLHRISEIESNR